MTEIVDGKNPKYFGDCHCIIPGNMCFSVFFITSDIYFGCYEASSGRAYLKKLGVTEGATNIEGRLL